MIITLGLTAITFIVFPIMILTFRWPSTACQPILWSHYSVQHPASSAFPWSLSTQNLHEGWPQDVIWLQETRLVEGWVHGYCHNQGQLHLDPHWQTAEVPLCDEITCVHDKKFLFATFIPRQNDVQVKELCPMPKKAKQMMELVWADYPNKKGWSSAWSINLCIKMMAEKKWRMLLFVYPWKPVHDKTMCSQ